MSRVLRFLKLIFKDIAKVVCVIGFFYGCGYAPKFIEAHPTITLTVLIGSMILCVLGLLGTWIKVEWDNSEEKEEYKEIKNEVN